MICIIVILMSQLHAQQLQIAALQRQLIVVPVVTQAPPQPVTGSVVLPRLEPTVDPVYTLGSFQRT